MSIKHLILKEFLKNGYSRSNGRRTWYLTNPNLLFATKELAEGFVKLSDFDVYKKQVIQRESKLLKNNGKKFFKFIRGDSPFNLIDLRCVGGLHASEFVNAIGPNVQIRYCPIGMHSSITTRSLKFVKGKKLKQIKDYKSVTSEFDKIVSLPATIRNSFFQKNVILLLGSTLALFEINDFLYQMSNNMLETDSLIIGIGIRNGPRLRNLQTYQDVHFNKWFMPLMNELGFDPSEISYDARFGPLRIECFYRILVNKSIVFKRKKIDFNKGDEIVVAVLYKYFEKELRKFCKMYFSKVEIIKDRNEYVLILCQK